ncbi:MAG: hypothetical protein F4Z29_01555 [Gemmatimonadetes bacterium]|nr:hypothetical protein [Gemmatimonadota bacterium]
MSEKAKLQSLFDPFNAKGSWITIHNPGSDPVNLGLVDSYTVTRVLSQGDGSSNTNRTEFWLLFKSVGYHESFHYSHTIKVVDLHQDDGWNMDLTDDRQRVFHIDMIFPEFDLDQHEQWMRWKGYRKEREDFFELVDKDILATHTLMARKWSN